VPLRPAFIWMDRRSANLCEIVQERLSHEDIVRLAGNRLSPGFAGASLAWLREAEPATLEQARAVVQPKDYIVLRLTGALSADPSDASATGLDIRDGVVETLAGAAASRSTSCASGQSAAVVGTLRPAAADALGCAPRFRLWPGRRQAALLLGAGVVEAGRARSRGTGGQITVVSSLPLVDSGNCGQHVRTPAERWYTWRLLNGGIALRGGVSDRPGHPLAYPDRWRGPPVPPGAEGLYYCRYLEGGARRIGPRRDRALRPTTRHTQAHLTRAGWKASPSLPRCLGASGGGPSRTIS